MKKWIIEIAGWYGMIAIVGAYALVSFSLITSTSLVYQLLNLTGSFGIIVVALRGKVYQSAILNTIWAFIALAAIARLFIK